MIGRKRESVRLKHPSGGSVQLDVSYDKAPESTAVLYVHGLGSTRAGEKAVALEVSCARRGWTFAALDFRGHGESTGTLLELTGSGILEDLTLVREYLASEGVQHLFPVGSSMGGWASAWFTARSPHTVPACVLLAPAIEFLHGRWSRLSEAERDAWRQTGRLRIQNEWLDAEIGYNLVAERDLFARTRLAKELTRPLLIFHGMRDEVIPFSRTVTFVEQAENPAIELRLIKDGDHRLSPYKTQIAEAACNFFAGQMPSK